MAEVYESRRPRRRWGRRLLITLIVLLVILGVIAVVLDRFGASFAERVISDRVAEQVASQDASSEKPDVTIQGVPFLTQVLAGEYQEIKIELRDFTGPAGNDKTIKLPLLDVRAKDVRAPLDTLRTRQGDIVASTVTGTATIDYPQLASLIGMKGLTLSERDGKLTGSAPIPVPQLGQTLNASGTATLTLRDGVIQVRFADVTAAELPDNPLIRAFIATQVQRLGIDLKVPALPLKLQLTKVEPTPAGLLVTAAASEVPLNAGGL